MCQTVFAENGGRGVLLETSCVSSLSLHRGTCLLGKPCPGFWQACSCRVLNLTHPSVLPRTDLRLRELPPARAPAAAPLPLPLGRAHTPPLGPACSLAFLGFYSELSYVICAERKYLFCSMRKGLFSVHLKDVAIVSP